MLNLIDASLRGAHDGRLDKRDVDGVARQCVRAALLLASVDARENEGSGAVLALALALAPVVWETHTPEHCLATFPLPFTLAQLRQGIEQCFNPDIYPDGQYSIYDSPAETGW